MPALALTPFAGLLELFALVPLALLAAIYGSESASGALRRRGERPGAGRPARRAGWFRRARDGAERR